MVGGQSRHVIGPMKDFLFGPEQAPHPARQALRRRAPDRLMLAQVLAKPSNVLVLDEPTNDLDLETLDVLEDHESAITPAPFSSISHDRDFLDRLVSSVIVAGRPRPSLEYAAATPTC